MDGDIYDSMTKMILCVHRKYNICTRLNWLDSIEINGWMNGVAFDNLKVR